MKYVKLFENYRNDHKIGDLIITSPGHALAHRKDDGDKHMLFTYKGHHPDMSLATGPFKITGETQDCWVLDNGKYLIDKKEASEFSSSRGKHESDEKRRKEDESREKELRDRFISRITPGTILVSKVDIFKQKPQGPVGTQLTDRSWKGDLFIEKGSKKKVTSISSLGIKISGYDDYISFLNASKFFNLSDI